MKKRKNPENKRFADGAVWFTEKEMDNLMIVLWSVVAFLVIFFILWLECRMIEFILGFIIGVALTIGCIIYYIIRGL